jgi:hypothetical protein
MAEKQIYPANTLAFLRFTKIVDGTLADLPVQAVQPAFAAPDPAPTNLTAFAMTSCDIDLTWDDTGSSYEIQRSLLPGSGFVTIATVSEPNYSDSGLAVATYYYYRVRAIGDLPSEYSSVESIFIPKDYSGAEAVYSFRNMGLGVETYIARVTRVSDGGAERVLMPANTNEFMTGDSLVEGGGTLSAWLGGSVGNIREWIDQTGNGHTIEQAGTVNQGAIIDATGNPIQAPDNNKPSIDFGTTAQVLNLRSITPITALDAGNPFSVMIRASRAVNNTERNAIFANGVGAGDANCIAMWLHTPLTVPDVRHTSVFAVSGYVQNLLLNPISIGTSYLMQYYATGTQGSAYHDSLADEQDVAYDNDYINTGITVGGTYGINQPLGGKIQEIVIYPTDEESNREEFLRDQDIHYS